MTKILAVFTFVLIVLLCSKIYAFPISLSPQETKQFTNTYSRPINATCTVQADDNTKNKIKISVLRNNGSVNGRNLSSGQSTSITVRNNESLTVRADVGTQINLINLGNQGVEAVCSTSA